MTCIGFVCDMYSFSTVKYNSFQSGAGFVISDCGAVNGITASHNYTHSPDATVAAAMNQGGGDVN